MNMDPYDNDGKIRIIAELANLIINISSIVPNHSDKNPVKLELSGLMHDILYHKELVTIFYPLDDHIEKCINNSKMNKQAAINFVTHIDRNIRKSFVTFTLFSLETILKIIAKHHGVKIPRNNIICKYKIVMKYFDVYSEDNENLVKILHYTRNTLHNGDRVDLEAHIPYKGKIFHFVPKEKQKKDQKLESTYWFNLTYFFLQLLDIFSQITMSKKYSFE